MIFYSEVVGVNSETLITSEDGSRKTVIDTNDLESHREDKVRITMDNEALASLYRMLKARFEPDENIKGIGSIEVSDTLKSFE